MAVCSCVVVSCHVCQSLLLVSPPLGRLLGGRVRVSGSSGTPRSEVRTTLCAARGSRHPGAREVIGNHDGARGSLNSAALALGAVTGVSDTGSQIRVGLQTDEFI